jgi:hypothetical protein
MDLSGLEPLGKIAGIGGIAIGAALLLIRPLIDRAGLIPSAQRGAFFRQVVLGAFGIGILGILAWLYQGTVGSPTASTSGSNSPGIVARGDVSIGGSEPGPAGSRSPTESSPLAGSATTRGDGSPAIVSGGNVRLSSPPSQTNPPTR